MDREIDICKGRKTSVLECRVCDDIFSPQGDKTPRLLFCGHTLCQACLSKLPGTTSKNAIICPFDRQPTDLGSNGVFDLKKNFALIELIERLHASESQLVFSQNFLNRERELAVPCDENESHLAVVYCTVCGSHLCDQCSDSSHATRTLSKHRRIPLSEKPREKPKCPYHTAHVMEFTCLEMDCRNAPLMCYICKDYGRHKGHRHNLLEMEAEKTRTTINVAVNSLKKFMEDVSETSRRLETVKQRILGQGSDTAEIGTAMLAKQRVRSYFQSLRDQLTMQESAALTVVDTYINERLCTICQQEVDIETILGQVAAVCAHCDRVFRQDDARVLLAAAEIRQMLDTLEVQQQQFMGVETEHFFPDASIPITFTKDNRVHIGPKIEMRVVTLGLDGSGKTSILFKLKQNEFVQTIPTIGFNVETLEYKNIKFTVWDVGGQHKLRPLWKHYYLNTQAVIFVIDASQRDRLTEAQDELIKLVAEKELKDACLLILINKQDIQDSLTIEEISNQISIYKLCSGKSWHIQGCDARSGDGLTEGLDWLSRQLVASGVQDLG